MPNAHVIASIGSGAWAQPNIGASKKTDFVDFVEGLHVWEPCEIESLYLKLTKQIH